jgi:hypothetical protein
MGFLHRSCQRSPVVRYIAGVLPECIAIRDLPVGQLAELDFLITTGILPRPAGVVTRRIPHRTRYNFLF